MIVVSADGDFASLLNDAVSWLRLRHLPSPSCPSSCELVTAAGFTAAYGYPPELHSDFLALTGAFDILLKTQSFDMQCGPALLRPYCHQQCCCALIGSRLRKATEFVFPGKPEASVPGVGVGPVAAKKLLRRFGSVGGALAAAHQGQLTGWGANVRTALGPDALSATERQLRRNMAVVGMCRDPVLDEATAAAITGASRGFQKAAAPADGASATSPEQAVRSDAAVLAWLHPRNVIRQRHIQPQIAAISGALAAAGISHRAFHALPSGLTVDIAIGIVSESQAGPVADSSCKQTALMVRTTFDLDGGPSEGPALPLKAQLSGRARQHSGLLRRSGWFVVDCDCRSDTVDLRWIVDCTVALH